MPVLIAKRTTYIGLFCITLATLLFEILLTRIFSVTMWYHFAFMAVSLALFGLTVGALAVYFLPHIFTRERTSFHLASSALLFAVFILISFMTHLSVPFVLDLSLVGIYSIVFTYTVLAVAFVFSGICVCLALTRFPQQISKLYAVDLAGAALGCILVIGLLQITDGPTAIFAVAGVAGLGAMVFALELQGRRLFKLAAGVVGLLFLFVIGNTFLVQQQTPILRLLWFKGSRQDAPLYEKWNSYSRIAVAGNPNVASRPFGWGLSPTLAPNVLARGLGLTIDAGAGTVLTAFDGNLMDLAYLKYDVTNVGHYIRSNGNVLVVGAGGGRDVLSALVFGQKAVTAVEINEDIVRAVNERFGNFTGHLDRDPRVRFVVDEARSYVARQDERFDMIQISLIDTWAATAAGAFALSENSLYTVEAWKNFLNHLAPRGVLSVSRWYSPERPGEAFRMMSIARAALTEMGIQDPAKHVVMISCDCAKGFDVSGIATMLVSREPFSDQDLDTLATIASELQFDVLYSARNSLDPSFAALVSGEAAETIVRNIPINVTASTDDSPFFFQLVRLQDVFSPEILKKSIEIPDLRGLAILAVLLVTVIGLSLVCIGVPLVLTTRREALRGAEPLIAFFAAIGLGFILIEISQLQRLVIFLGHPIYSLAVVLFTLLLASSIGSSLTQRVIESRNRNGAIRRFTFLLAALILFGIVTPIALQRFENLAMPLRILLAIGILFPLGLFMGMPFPLGITLAGTRWEALTPWFWGINGGASVVASVLAVVVSLSYGISAAFWVGFACYVVAAGAFLLVTRRQASWRA